LPILHDFLRLFSPRREKASKLHLPPGDHELPSPLRSVRFILWVGLGVVTLLLAFFFFRAFSSSKSGGLTGHVMVDGGRISISHPRLTGVRKNNAPYEVTAVAASQDKKNMSMVDLKDLKAFIGLDSTNHVAVRAPSGTYDMSEEKLDVRGEVLFTEKKTGNRLTLHDAHIDLKEGTLTAGGPVDFVSHALSIQAKGLEVTNDGKVIVFQGPVRMLIHQAQFLPLGVSKKGAKHGS
jgi:lipopolysaccharide export system protein LptC